MKRDLFLYLTTFICGMAIMGVELSTTRYLAPYYGSSMITWTIVIGVIMTSLSIGNFIGGVIADTPSARDRMYKLIWSASLWIAFIPFVGKYLIGFSFFFLVLIFPENIFVAGVLFSCLMIFSLPCVVLGAVTPCLIRLGIKNIEQSGRVAGELYAISTIGSIVGTILPTFYLIPVIGTSKTFLVFAFLLNVLSMVYLFSRKLHAKKEIVVTVIIGGLCFFPYSPSFSFWTNPVLEEESLYNYLRVSESGDELSLSTHVQIGRQSVYRKGALLSQAYFDYALAAPFFTPRKLQNEQMRFLVLGFGAGTYARLCRHFFPKAIIDGVEIDRKILDLGFQYMGLLPGDANIFCEDGRAFLARHQDRQYDVSSQKVAGNSEGAQRPTAGDEPCGFTPRGEGGRVPPFIEKIQYDVIFLDAFQDVSTPFHMATREFFALVKSRLSEMGCLVINVSLRTEENQKMSDLIAATVRSEFQKVYSCVIPDRMNTIIFATNEVGDRINFRKNVGEIREEYLLTPILKYVADNLSEVQKSNEVFTDDLAPVEMVGFHVLSDILKENLKAAIVSLLIAFRNT